MKKKLLFLYLLIFITLSSCNKDQEGCVTCVVDDSKAGMVEFAFLPNLSKTTSIDYWYADDNREGIPDYFLGNLKGSDEYLNLSLKYIENKNIDIKRKVLGIVFYINQNLDSKITLKDNNIKGFSIYTEVRSFYKHKLFVREGKSFVEDNSKQFFRTGITTNDLAGILNYSVIKGNQNKSYLIVLGQPQKKKKL